jgi:flagellar protein FliO/FliZ
LAAGLAGPWLAAAAAAAQEKAAPAMEGGGFTLALVKMVGGLAAVLALMAILYWLLRRFAPGQIGGGRAGKLKLLGRLGLGPKKGVALVEVAGSVLVLGVGEDGVRLLDKVTDPARVAELTEAGQGFAGALGRASRRKEGEESS